MATIDELNFVQIIVMRYQKLVRDKGLLPSRTDEELLEHLCAAHTIQPLNFRALAAQDDLDLVIAVGDIDLHYCHEARRIKDNFHSRFAL